MFFILGFFSGIERIDQRVLKSCLNFLIDLKDCEFKMILCVLRASSPYFFSLKHEECLPNV